MTDTSVIEAPPGGFLTQLPPATVAAPDPALAAAAAPSGTLNEPNTPPSSLFASDFRDEQGNLKEGWSEVFEKKGFTRLANKAATHKTEDDFLKSLDHMAQFVGKKTAFLPPNDKSTPEEIAAYREQQGVPAEAKEYAFKPAKLPDGIDWDPAAASKAEEILHKHHIPKAAAQELADYYGDVLLDTQVKAKTNFETNVSMKAAECEKTFKDEWGAAYQSRFEANRDFAKVLFGDELTDPIMQAALARPSVVRLIDQARRDLRGGLPGAQADTAGGSASPGQQAQAIMKANPNWSTDPADHRRITDLFNLQAQIDSRRK